MSAALVLAVSSSAARADEALPAPRRGDLPGVYLGVGASFGVPIGSLASGDGLPSNIGSMLPLSIDGGYRLSPQLEAGGYFQWAPAFVARAVCPSPPFDACSANDVRFGLQMRFRFLHRAGGEATLDPWIGVGTGYEILSFALSRNADVSHQNYRGFEFGNLQLGADYLGLGSVRLGGFAGVSVGEFSRTTLDLPSGGHSYPVDQPAVHAWFFLGIRGQYDF